MILFDLGLNNSLHLTRILTRVAHANSISLFILGFNLIFSIFSIQRIPHPTIKIQATLITVIMAIFLSKRILVDSIAIWKKIHCQLKTLFSYKSFAYHTLLLLTVQIK